jgi:hypothetical protein
MGPDLGLDGDSKFLNQCVDSVNGDDPPTIHVMNPYSYFNVTGNLTIRNLRFSGL